MDKFWVKLVINGLIVVPLLIWFAGVGFITAAAAAVVLCVVAYVLGDRMILAVSNNTIATISDFILTFGFLWVLALLANWPLNFTEIMLISGAVAVVEIFYHMYVVQREVAAR